MEKEEKEVYRLSSIFPPISPIFLIREEIVP
jgi:hypothetical protein